MSDKVSSSLSARQVASFGGERRGPALLRSRSDRGLRSAAAPGRLLLVSIGGLVCLGIGLLTAGCRSRPGVAENDDVRQNLQRIGVAYEQARLRLGRPPRNLKELLPSLQDPARPGDVKDLLRSPNDGEEYVIVWGVEFGALAKQVANPYVVFAYEKHGRGGKRYAMHLPNYVSIMTDAEFKKAPFPPGHQPQL